MVYKCEACHAIFFEPYTYQVRENLDGENGIETRTVAECPFCAVTATAYAREPEKKTGMDESQITGTASSYARKYALNGLFCIDDTKDADTDEYKQQEKKEKPSKAEMESFNQAYKEQFDYTCQDCKQPITPQSFNGKLYRVSDISKGAMKKYGVPLCWACMEKRKANE